MSSNARGAFLCELAESHAATAPERVATLCGNDALTYGELNLRANRLAHALIDRGVGPEQLVGIALGRSHAMLIAVLATLKAGAAYLPLDPAYPPARLALMRAQAKPAITLTEASFAAFARDRSRDSDPRDADRTMPLRLEHPAYVIYTSGSTGTPKGVVVSHAGIVNLAHAQRERLGIVAGSRVLQFASLSFDASVAEIAMTFAAGATLVLIAEDARTGPALHEALRAGRVTHATLPPVTLGTLPYSDDLALQGLIVAGEEPPAQVVRAWSARVRLINAYGPTEATVCATMSGPLGDDGDAPIGAPLPQTRAYVLDDRLNAVPAGTAGELYLAGLGLARGYLNRPALTAERFVADPNPAVSGARMYRTGDVVRARRDGALVFVGRSDGQLKIRGYRVEPGEIEATLYAQPGVAQAAVIVRDRGSSAPQLVAYVVAIRGRVLEAVTLRQALRDRLPDWMIPAAVVIVESLPQTPAGKLDRNALPPPAGEREAYRAPSTREQRTLSALFAAVLAVDGAGIDDDFFALGGDSISAVAVVGRARLAGLALTQRDVFEHRTVAALAAAATATAALEWDGAPASAPAAGPWLTPVQEALLTAARTGAQGEAVQLSIEFSGTLDADRMRSAAEHVLQRHETLRAAIRWSPEGRPVATIPPAVNLSWSSHDLSGCDAGMREERHAAFLAADRAAPFVLARGQLVRFMLVQLDARRFELTFTSHYLILDGWSIPLLFAEFFALYRCGGDAGALPAPTPFRSYLVWVANQDSEPARRVWRHELAGFDRPSLLAPAASSGYAPGAERHLRAEVSVDVTAGLQALARGRGLTLNTILQGTWAVLLGQLTARADVVFGVTVSGRPAELPGVEQMVGSFLNEVPLRARLHPGMALSALFAEIQAGQARLLGYHHVPLSEIQPAGSDGPLFDTLLTFQNYPHDGAAFSEPAPGLHIASVRGSAPLRYPLVLVIVPGAPLIVTFSYDRTLFSPERIGEIAARFTRLLARAVEAPDAAPFESAGAGPAPAPTLTSINPFDDEHARFTVLVNGAGQYSLWPAFCAIPAGWFPAGPAGARTTCLDWIDATWTGPSAQHPAAAAELVIP